MFTTNPNPNPECSYFFHAGWNLITLSHLPDPPYTAATLANAINNQGGSITKLQKWDGSGWKTYSAGASFGDFSIEGGSIIKMQRWDGSGWKTYSTGAPFGDFAIDSKEGYSLLATGPSTLDISPFKISNVRDNQFTVSWTSDSNENATVNYGTYTDLGQTACVDRGQVFSITHHVTITGLSPNTKYYYQVVSGSRVFNDNSGNHFTITTGPSIIPFGSVSPAGQVFQSDVHWVGGLSMEDNVTVPLLSIR